MQFKSPYVQVYNLKKQSTGFFKILSSSLVTIKKSFIKYHSGFLP